MPNYEELYNIARTKYHQAIENKNNIQRTSSELQSRKNSLSRELSQKQEQLREAKNKLALLQETEDFCKAILNGEFETMKKSVQRTAEEYRKIISSDQGVADIQAIYAGDINSTQNDLNTILEELSRKRREIEEQVTNSQNSVDQCNNEIRNVSSQLNQVGDLGYAQRQINNYYAQMKEYQRKWESGC